MNQGLSIKNELFDLLQEAQNLLGGFKMHATHHELMTLLSYATKRCPIDIYLKRLSILGYEREYFLSLVKEKIFGQPLQYILGTTNFFGFDFRVEEGVFIPRPETEILVEELIALIRHSYFQANSRNSLSICDIGTGCGNIAISLTKSIDNCKILATDISLEALIIAKENAINNSVIKDISFLCTDIFEGIKTRFDIIVSNPPYIPRSVIRQLPAEVKKEPMAALDGGDDGLDFYRRITTDAQRFLNTDALLVFEIGDSQSDKVRDILKKNDFQNIHIIKDLNNMDRVIMAQWIN